jgi:prepilin-type processing-associated H-X9-DG protein
MNNQKDLGVAMQSYVSSHKSLPGWRNTVTTLPAPGTTSSSGTATVSWVTMLLPNLERNDIWQNQVMPNGQWIVFTTSGTGSAAYLSLLSCPSDPPPATTGVGPSSYIANGLVLRDQYLYNIYLQNPTNSTYLKNYAPLAPQTIDYVSGADGSSNTLMLGENTQVPPASAAGALPKAHNWYDVDTAIPSTYQIKQTFGFPLTTSGTYYPAGLTTYLTAIYGTAYANGNGPFGQYNGNAMTANMNSSHSGGAVVTFFDGHCQFLRDDAGLNTTTGNATYPTAYTQPITVYQILVTPEGSKNGTEPPADESLWQ